jgi:nicotinamide mononucleotide transporter
VSPPLRWHCAFFVFRSIGAGFPAPWWYYLADAWIFVGSIAATYAMARGWIEFWLCWIAVDLVGVPELIYFKFYPSAALYGIYAVFVIWGFFVWRRSQREQLRVDEPSAEVVGA